mgnify:CR=1 FL=1
MSECENDCRSVDITERLRELADEEYRAFQSRLVPNVPFERILGVRIPRLRKYAAEIRRGLPAREFIANPRHIYYDENNLHGLLISYEDDYERALKLLDEFLPYVDNWATCDLISPRAIAKHTDRLYTQIEKWLDSSHTYTVRFGIDMLIKYFAADLLTMSQLERVASLAQGDYYIDMAAAWYFATAMIWHKQEVLSLLESGQIDGAVRAKTIQKALESYRISDDTKAYLREIRGRA